MCANPIAKSVFDIMANKRTNLCLSADVTQIDELLEVICKQARVNPY